MKCPACENLDDKVLESRTMDNGESIRRRRECLNCGYRFTSYEHIEEKPFMVIKKDGRRQLFDEKKLKKGIERALEKNTFTDCEIESIVQEASDNAKEKGKISREITTSDLGDLVLETLQTKDKVAYMRFASVYKNFEDLKEFIKEAKKIDKK